MRPLQVNKYSSQDNYEASRELLAIGVHDKASGLLKTSCTCNSFNFKSCLPGKSMLPVPFQCDKNTKMDCSPYLDGVNKVRGVWTSQLAPESH